MSQFLIVQSGAAEAATAVFRRGLQMFEILAGLLPSECSTGPVSVAAFPAIKSGPPALARGPAPGDWICGAGTWFYDGASGQEGLRRIERAAREKPDSDWLKPLDGAFALALCRGGRLQVITDPLGTLHVYAARTADCNAVCTSSLVLAALTRPEWDIEACREFLATGIIYERKTFFSGIAKLPPAAVVEFGSNGIEGERKYWIPAEMMYDRAARRGTVSWLAEALQESVATVARNFPHALLDLTGGFDSRAVLAAALARGLRFETVVSGRADDPDVVVSRTIAQEFGLPHHHNPPPKPPFEEWWAGVRASVALSDGELDVFEYSRTAAAHTRAAASFDASINGSNGEVCKGYWWELLFPYTRRRDHFDPAQVAARRFVPGGDPGLLAGPFSDTLVEHFAGVIERANVGLERHPNTAKLDNVYLRMRMQRWQGRIASSTNRIWPCISPFAFRGPMEAALAAPPGVRLRNRMSRKLIERLNPRLAALPLTGGYPALPLRLTTAHRFWPLLMENAETVSGYLRRRLGRSVPPAPESPYPFSMAELWQRDEIAGLLDVREMETRNLYQPSRLQDLLAASRRPGFGRTRQMGRILTLEMAARAVREARRAA
jgi:asparagine synthase (glutamine-hydrolysing)